MYAVTIAATCMRASGRKDWDNLQSQFEYSVHHSRNVFVVESGYENEDILTLINAHMSMML